MSNKGQSIIFGYIGKLLTVQFLGLTDDGKPKIAKGKDIREGY